MDKQQGRTDQGGSLLVRDKCMNLEDRRDTVDLDREWKDTILPVEERQSEDSSDGRCLEPGRVGVSGPPEKVWWQDMDLHRLLCPQTSADENLKHPPTVSEAPPDTARGEMANHNRS